MKALSLTAVQTNLYSVHAAINILIHINGTNILIDILGGSHYTPIPDTLTVDETDISLVTGKMRSTVLNDNVVETGGTMILRSDSLTVATQADTAGWCLELK